MEKIWLFRSSPYGEGDRLDVFKPNGFISFGFDYGESLKKMSESDIKDLVDTFETKNKKLALQLNYVVNEIDIGDIILTPKDDDIHIGRVTERYKFDDQMGSIFQHRLGVAWVDVRSKDNFSEDIKKYFNLRGTIYKIKSNNVKESILKIGDTYTPKIYQNASISDFTDNDNKILIDNIDRLCTDILSGDIPKKGLYIYGDFGVGKTHLMYSLKNKLRETNYNFIFLNYPIFINDVKKYISNDGVENYIKWACDADILVFDDIGNGNYSSWLWESVLFPILDYRMLEEKLTLFTSNLSINKLEQYLLTSNHRVGTNQLKLEVTRLTERIKVLTNEFKLQGSNKREK